ncbi:HEAT repeat domain-containing protein [Gorillibacterium massiliense]|uniref:HEAT repeat domain-containing protein n=1 Tax=Gorillibacterium massiliense TaxID=1280390 RepID=UPI0004B5776E|nr:HEAT repeat domain-containing protein [Gorillibacterium massiliense]
MDNHEVNNELPENYAELKKSANRTANWRERLSAVEELGKWNTTQTIDILKNRMLNDTVYQVQEAAYHKLKALGVDVQLPPRKKGDLLKDASKTFLRVRKSLPYGHTFEEYKEKLQKMRSDLYDTYEGDKGEEFEQWLESKWASLAREWEKK